MFYIVISTFGETYKPILNSLLETIPKGLKIIIVHAKSEDNSYKINDDIIDVNITKNLYEYSAWIGVDFLIKQNVINPEDWYLFTHDTTLFTSQTKQMTETILNTIHRTPINFYSLIGGGFHNICLCRRDAITKIADLFSKYENLTKDQANFYESKLPDMVDVNTVGEYICGTTHFIDGIEGLPVLPGRKTVLLSSINLYKFYS
jgi:hypothetical protein